jgi:hypothetical protein
VADWVLRAGVGERRRASYRRWVLCWWVGCRVSGWCWCGVVLSDLCIWCWCWCGVVLQDPLRTAGRMLRCRPVVLSSCRPVVLACWSSVLVVVVRMCLDFYAVGLRGLVVDCGASGRVGGGDGGIWLILATCWWAVGIWSADPAGDVTEGVVVVGSGGGTPAGGIWRYWCRCCSVAG